MELDGGFMSPYKEFLIHYQVVLHPKIEELTGPELEEVMADASVYAQMLIQDLQWYNWYQRKKLCKHAIKYAFYTTILNHMRRNVIS